MEWITVKTLQGHIGQVLVDPSQPIQDQISDQAIWWGRNLPHAPQTDHAGPVFFWLIVFVMVATVAILGSL